MPLQTPRRFFSIFKKDEYELVHLSFLLLFIELTLIRWTGSNIYFLFFFANFILLASFLGIGIGFLRNKPTANLFALSPLFLALVIFCCYYFSFSYHARINPETDNLIYDGKYFKENCYPLIITLPLVFLTVMLVMASITSGVARLFQQFSPLAAYRLEILGSLSGAIIFSLLSLFHASPLYWGIIIGVCYLFLLIKKRREYHALIILLQIFSLAVILLVFAKETMTPNHFWSPYYKIELQPYTDHRFVVNVNGLPQQIVESVDQRKKVKPFYFLPYQYRALSAKLENVLVIGAGTGGDVAIALSQGAKLVDAVEIDPMLYQLGKKFNPNQPYNDKHVRVFIDDGRAFLQRNKKKYDMIIFALTDSLQLIPGQSSLRLENFLYTFEGLAVASQHIKTDGVFVIYNYYRQHWFVDRLAKSLTLIYHQSPCVATYSETDYWATVLAVGFAKSALQCPYRWQATATNDTTLSTDNHPFIYLKENQFSILHALTLFFIFITTFYAIKKSGGSYQSIRQYADLFFMGAAFLLLETKNIVQFALLFGTTWFVNALVFIGILFTVYLAVEVTHYSKRYQSIFLPGILFAALFLNWITPTHFLLSLPLLLRFVTASFLAFLPIFIANLIFAQRFRSVTQQTFALGANLIGAMLGGLLEYFSLIVGYQHLLFIIGFLYILAILFSGATKKVAFSPS